MSAVVPLAQTGMEILAKLLTIAASPQGLELLARLMGPSQTDIDKAVAGLKEAPEPKKDSS